MKREPIQTDSQCSVWFPYNEPFTVCAHCTGPLMPLGQLGVMSYYRCRNCGSECAAMVN